MTAPRQDESRPAASAMPAMSALTARGATLGLLLTVLFWAGNFTATKIALTEIPPLPFTGVRFFLGTAVLAHDLMARARRAPVISRETPVTWVQKDGTMIEGVLDLAFEEDGVTMVVDFKTDIEMVNAQDAYKQLVALYCEAVTRATGRPAKGVLLRV